MHEDEKIPVDDLIEEMSEERRLVAFARALKSQGIEYEWADEYGLEVDGDLDELRENEDLMDAFETELKTMVTNDMLRSMADRGILVETGVNPEGEIDYALATGMRV